MSDLDALKEIRNEQIFREWPGEVPDDKLQSSLATVHQLIDDLLALGAEPAEDAVQAAAAKCVQKFNEIDDGWITTPEREDISDIVSDIVSQTGYEFDEDLLDAR